jgi:hypothetical protein
MRAALLLLLLVLPACATPPAGPPILTARVGAAVTLRPGQQAVIQGTGITLRFVGVPEDGRCPVDLQCVWAGDARVELELSRGGVPDELELRTTLDPRVVPVDSFTLRLEGLDPAPRTSRPIDASDYRARVRVARAPG